MAFVPFGKSKSAPAKKGAAPMAPMKGAKAPMKGKGAYPAMPFPKKGKK